MEAPQHVGLGGYKHDGGAGHGRCRLGHRAMIVSFEDLQALSGMVQVGKVVDWLREQHIRFVIGGDGKPRTTKDLLEEDLSGQKREATAIRFG